METIFKVGDKVRIRRDLQAGLHYDKVIVAPKMLDWAGQYLTIKRIVTSTGSKTGYAYVMLGADSWVWTDAMISRSRGPVKEYMIQKVLSNSESLLELME